MAAFDDADGGFPSALTIMGYGDQPCAGLVVARNGKAFVLCDAVQQSG